MSALSEIKAARAKLDEANEAYDVELHRIIEAYHPLQTGDIVELARGNSYVNIGRQMLVKSRHIRLDRTWMACGPLINKDGSESKNDGEWRQEIVE